MELWIRSQDKMKLVSNCNLYISNEIRNEYVIEDLSNKYLKLGTYKTKERALEVLDEIQRIIHPIVFISSEISTDDNNWVENGIMYQKYKDNFNIQKLSTYVYQMPEN